MPGGGHNESGTRKDGKRSKKAGKREERYSVDLRHILGFLNQTEWI